MRKFLEDYGEAEVFLNTSPCRWATRWKISLTPEQIAFVQTEQHTLRLMLTEPPRLITYPSLDEQEWGAGLKPKRTKLESDSVYQARVQEADRGRIALKEYLKPQSFEDPDKPGPLSPKFIPTDLPYRLVQGHEQNDLWGALRVLVAEIKSRAGILYSRRQGHQLCPQIDLCDMCGRCDRPRIRVLLRGPGRGRRVDCTLCERKWAPAVRSRKRRAGPPLREQSKAKVLAEQLPSETGAAKGTGMQEAATDTGS